MRPLKNVQFCPRSRKAKILTTGIHRVFRGLEFEPDAACLAIALAKVEDWAKGGVFQRSHTKMLCIMSTRVLDFSENLALKKKTLRLSLPDRSVEKLIDLIVSD